MLLTIVVKMFFSSSSSCFSRRRGVLVSAVLCGWFGNHSGQTLNPNPINRASSSDCEISFTFSEWVSLEEVPADETDGVGGSLRAEIQNLVVEDHPVLGKTKLNLEVELAPRRALVLPTISERSAPSPAPPKEVSGEDQQKGGDGGQGQSQPDDPHLSGRPMAIAGDLWGPAYSTTVVAAAAQQTQQPSCPASSNLLTTLLTKPCNLNVSVRLTGAECETLSGGVSLRLRPEHEERMLKRIETGSIGKMEIERGGTVEVTYSDSDDEGKTTSISTKETPANTSSSSTHLEEFKENYTINVAVSNNQKPLRCGKNSENVYVSKHKKCQPVLESQEVTKSFMHGVLDSGVEESNGSGKKEAGRTNRRRSLLENTKLIARQQRTSSSSTVDSSTDTTDNPEPIMESNLDKRRMKNSINKNMKMQARIIDDRILQARLEVKMAGYRFGFLFVNSLRSMIRLNHHERISGKLSSGRRHASEGPLRHFGRSCTTEHNIFPLSPRITTGLPALNIATRNADVLPEGLMEHIKSM